MDTLKWEFAPTNGGDVTGSNDPVTSVFKGGGDFFYHLARESIQNVIDARDPKTLEPAKAEISLINLQPSNFPSSDRLRHVFSQCRDECKNSKDDYNFYSKAIDKLIHNSFVPILKISDYNTTGLIGSDDDKDGAYFSLMKAVGSSSKSGSAGGSYGLGKGAYFRASSFRTIFVSSKSGKGDVVFQGKARISSFKENGKWMQGNGCCGLENQKPVRETKLVPSLFRRDETGTDIYILGYEGDENWRSAMVKSVLNNFWFAISERILEVEIDGININSDSVENLLEKNFDKEKPDKKGDENPWPYYIAYRDGKQITQKLAILGNVTLFLKDGENFPSKIAYLRKIGMVIQKKGLNAPLTYAGVFVCTNDRGNKILKKMENPSHDEWALENARESEYATDAENAEKEMRDFIRDSVIKSFSNENTQSLNVGGLEEFLWLEGDLGVGGIFGQQLDNKTSQTETGTVIGREIKKDKNDIISRRLDVLKEIKKGSPGGTEHILGKGKKTKKGGGHEDELGENEVVALQNLKFRSFASKNSQGIMEHVITIKGPPDTECFLEILAGTDDSFENISILKAYCDNNNYKISENRIYGLKIDSYGKLEIKVDFKDSERYSLNITAYANK